MADIGTFLLFLGLCVVVAVGTTILQYQLRKRRSARAKQETNVPAKQDPSPQFVVGRIYQMEDGSLAKYIGDDQFLKVKMK